MKRLEVEWATEDEDVIPLSAARAPETPAVDGEMSVRKQTTLIVITKSGAVLHRSVHGSY